MKLSQKVLSIHFITREPIALPGFRVFSDGVRKSIEKTLLMKQPLALNPNQIPNLTSRLHFY